MRVAREAQPARFAITPLRPSPIAPLSPSDMGEAAKAFWGLSVRCVYEVPRPDVRLIEAASTVRHRPERGTPRGGATQRGVGTGDLYRGARS
jgi:hypothetical protein